MLMINQIFQILLQIRVSPLVVIIKELQRITTMFVLVIVMMVIVEIIVKIKVICITPPSFHIVLTFALRHVM